jgi:hypothetical protein
LEAGSTLRTNNMTTQMNLRALACACVALFLVLAGCIDVRLPDDLGEESDDSTTSDITSDETGDEAPSDLPASDTSETDETTDESTETGDDAAAVCCTCGGDFVCWEWGSMSPESCEVDQANALGEPTHWCVIDAGGIPSACFAACE